MMQREPPGGADAGPPPEPGLETRRMQGAIEQALFGRASAPVRVGRFAILELIGQGGMGRVYLAYDPRLDRRVAVKVMRTRDPSHTARLSAEALALARLSHPNVVTVYEVGDHDDGVFVAMEYVDGGTLERWCSPTAPTRDRWRAVLALAEQAAAGLVAAHAVGIVHRDLKPANMLIGGDGRLRLADFGLALHEPAPREIEAAGTPAYMAPEQFEGVADARSDQFSLCASFFHALYGRRCRVGDDGDDAPAAIVASIPARAYVPRHVEAALLRGLARAPAERFDSVAALLAALRPQPRALWGWLGAAVGAAALAGAAIVGGDTETVGCELDADALAPAWSDARRAQVRSGVLDSGARHAVTTLARVEETLATIERRWHTQRDAACEAARAGDPERQHAGLRQQRCLAAAAQTLDALTARLVRPDLDTITRAPDALVLLGDLTDCSDRSLAFELDDARAAALLQTLHEGRIAAELDDGPSASAAFTRILDETATGELPRLRAVAHRQLAQYHDERDDRAAMHEHERAWLDEAELAGDGALVAAAWAAMAVSLEPTVPLETAWFYLERARVHERRGALDDAQRAELDWQAALVLAARGEHPRAIELLRRTLDVFERTDHPKLPQVLKALSDSLIVGEDFAGALALRRRALQWLEARLGAEHPDVADLRVSLAEACGLAQDEATALILLDEALAIYDANPSHRPFNRAMALVSRGTARANLGQHELAVADLERAEDLLTRVLPADDPLRVLPLDPLARALFALDRRGHALDVIDRALRTAGPDDDVTRHDHQLLRAEILATLGRVDEATRAIERAGELRPLAFAPGSVSALQAVEEAARVLIALGRHADAERELTAALAAAPDMPGQWRARLDVHRARALAGLGRRAEALTLAQAVHATLEGTDALPNTRTDLDALLASLAAPG